MGTLEGGAGSAVSEGQWAPHQGPAFLLSQPCCPSPESVTVPLAAGPNYSEGEGTWNSRTHLELQGQLCGSGLGIFSFALWRPRSQAMQSTVAPGLCESSVLIIPL